MIKKISAIALSVLLLALLSPSPVQAEGGLTVLENSHEAQFPYELRFNLSVESNVDITDIRLHYTVDRVSFAQVVSETYIKFTPATVVNAEWSWDMREVGGLPPGAGIDYWWTVVDASGDRLKTTPIRIQLDDNRYSWESISRDNVTIYWYHGNEAFVQELMTAAQQALSRLAEDTGAHLERPVEIYVYADANDLRGALVFPQEWTGGVAFTEYGIIAIGIAPSNLTWGKRAIAHELTHLVTEQMTSNPYIGLPTWLNEGLSMYAEGNLEPAFESYLDSAIAEGTLISVRSLSSPFSAYAEESYLSYAQSYSLVEFLINTYGRDKMLELLGTFRQGSSYDGALEKVYGFDMDGLNALWRDYVTHQYQEVPVTTAAMPPPLNRVSVEPTGRLVLGSGVVS